MSLLKKNGIAKLSSQKVLTCEPVNVKELSIPPAHQEKPAREGLNDFIMRPRQRKKILR